MAVGTRQKKQRSMGLDARPQLDNPTDYHPVIANLKYLIQLALDRG
jgi:hypothetical protein